MEGEALGSTDDDRVQSSGRGDDQETAPKQDVLHKVTFMTDLEKPSMEPLSVPSASSRWKEEEDHELEERIKMAKAEMREVKEENERLKRNLEQVMKDYESLKRKFEYEIDQERDIHNQGKKSSRGSCTIINNNDNNVVVHDHDEFEEVDDMVSLTLGRFSDHHQNKNNNSTWKQLQPQPNNHWGSHLGVVIADHDTNNIKTPSSNIDDHINIQTPMDDHTHDEPKEDEAHETCPPGKLLKGLPAPPAGAGTAEDEVSQQNPPKKARVCVRARCDTPTLNDGCQWRKYGQKIAKGNPCPRAYYRCTGAPSCPVRKQVQRSVDDISILITTYEGTHNHPLPVSAMAMASTTSAAASMLLSGPSSSTASRPGISPQSVGAGTAGNLHGMNLYLSNNNNTNSKQFYLPNSSMLSSPLNHPTITLDLTSNPPSTSSSSSSPFHKLIPSTNNNYPSKYPFTSLDFGSSHQHNNNFMSWNNSNTQLAANYNISKNAMGSMMTSSSSSSSDHHFSKPLHNNLYQACLQQFTKLPSSSTQPPPSDTIAAATKAITSDPSFQSALAAALSSIIGGGGETTVGNSMSSNVQGGGQYSSLGSQQGAGGSMGFQGGAPPSSSILKTTTHSSSLSPSDSRDNAK